MTGPLVTEPGDGRVWARMRDFRASFGADGFVVLPVFGKRSPREWPVAFTVESATVGGEPLDVAALGAARADGDVDEVARRDLREVYHLDVDRVEQTFVFDTLPAGELVVRLGVDTDLVASERDGLLRFSRVHTARCVEMPLSSFGHLACSLQTGNVLFPGGSQGRLCLGGAIGRYVNSIQSSGTLGAIQTFVDPLSLPQPTGSVAAIPGQTW